MISGSAQVVQYVNSPLPLAILIKFQLLPGIRCKLLTADGVEIEVFDEPGELVVQSHSVVLGYLKNEKASKETFLPDMDGHGRWMRTGDEAKFSVVPSGNIHLTITDRIKELIKVKVRRTLSQARLGLT